MADEEVQISSLRGRSLSNMMSGMSIDRSHEIYSQFTQSELEDHFARFKQYDLDSTGFITPGNLKLIFEALGMPEVTVEQCANMVEEVAILIGHDNDGKLTFREYCQLMSYEAKKRANAEEVEAEEERRLSMREEDDEVAPVEEPITRLRGSSFAVLESLAVSRIKNFEQALLDKKASDSQPVNASQRKFASKLSKFQKLETGGSIVNTQEEKHKQTLKAKLAAFEAANKQADPVAFKTTWKNVQPGNWKQKKTIAGGVAPKKTLADLP